MRFDSLSIFDMTLIKIYVLFSYKIIFLIDNKIYKIKNNIFIQNILCFKKKHEKVIWTNFELFIHFLPNISIINRIVIFDIYGQT